MLELSAPIQAPPRIRLRYRKDQVLMYVSHLDLLRLLVRWLRRAEIPFGTSGKFSPKPRITFGPALSLGVAAENELLDIELSTDTIVTAGVLDHFTTALTKVAEPRDFVQDLRELNPQDPPIARAAKHAQYTVTYPSHEGAQAAFNLLTSAEGQWNNLPETQQDPRKAILQASLDGASVYVLGSCSSAPVLNIIKVASAATGDGAAEPLAFSRKWLLDSQMRQL